jgi:hypothetical protein
MCATFLYCCPIMVDNVFVNGYLATIEEIVDKPENWPAKWRIWVCLKSCGTTGRENEERKNNT